MQQRHAELPTRVTHDDGFRSWCDARDPALHRLALLMTADPSAARGLVAEVLSRMDCTWSRIGALAADHTARALLVDAYRRRGWQHGVAPDPRGRQEWLDDPRLAAWEAVAQLPGQVRVAAVLTRHEGLDDAGAGRLLRLSPGAVRVADGAAVAAVAAVLDEVRRRAGAGPSAPTPVPDPGRLLTEALTTRADTAAYTPVPREEVEAAASGLRRRRRLLLAGGAGVVVAVLFAGAGLATGLGVGPAEPPKAPAA